MPFASVPYFESWLNAFGGPNSGVWRPDGAPVIAYVRAPLRLGLIRVTAVHGATNDHTARYDILGDLVEPARMLHRMQKALCTSMFCFEYLARDSRLLSAVRANDSKLWYQLDFCEDSPYVDCRLPWEEYWASRGTSRQLWARRERKLMHDLGATFRCLERWEQIEPVLPAVYDVEASGWKGREGSAIRQSPNTLDFYNRCMRHWAERGWLRLFLLELAGEIIAFQITVLHDGVLYQIKVGYQERHAKLSPGQVLQVWLLREAFANPAIRAYDMLGGGGKAAANKRKWATGAETLYTLRVFRKSMGGLLAWLRFVVAPRLKTAILPRRVHKAVSPEGDQAANHGGS
jgi:hypothetical protein